MINTMSPLVNYMCNDLHQGKFLNRYGPEANLPLVDPADIGAFVVAAFSNTFMFSGKTINVASEKLNVLEIVTHISNAAGQAVQAVFRSAEELERECRNPLISGQVRSRNLAGLVGMHGVEGYRILLTSFVMFLAAHKDAVIP